MSAIEGEVALGEFIISQDKLDTSSTLAISRLSTTSYSLKIARIMPISITEQGDLTTAIQKIQVSAQSDIPGIHKMPIKIIFSDTQGNEKQVPVDIELEIFPAIKSDPQRLVIYDSKNEQLTTFSITSSIENAYVEKLVTSPEITISQSKNDQNLPYQFFVDTSSISHLPYRGHIKIHYFHKANKILHIPVLILR